MNIKPNKDSELVDQYGETAEEWGKRLFEFSYCEECGGDYEDHDIIPFLGNWFARCKGTDIDIEERYTRRFG